MTTQAEFIRALEEAFQGTRVPKEYAEGWENATRNAILIAKTMGPGTEPSQEVLTLQCSDQHDIQLNGIYIRAVFGEDIDRLNALADRVMGGGSATVAPAPAETDRQATPVSGGTSRPLPDRKCKYCGSEISAGWLHGCSRGTTPASEIPILETKHALNAESNIGGGGSSPYKKGGAGFDHEIEKQLLSNMGDASESVRKAEGRAALSDGPPSAAPVPLPEPYHIERDDDGYEVLVLHADAVHDQEEKWLRYDIYERLCKRKTTPATGQTDAIASNLAEALFCALTSLKSVLEETAQEHRKRGVVEMGERALAAYRSTPVREIVSPPPEMSMRMADVRVGMCLKSLYGGPVVTVTEITEKGFKYNHPPYSLGPRFGSTEGGEHYGYNGYSHYTLVVSKEQGRRGSDE